MQATDFADWCYLPSFRPLYRPPAASQDPAQVGEGVHDLLRPPVGGGMLGDVEVEDATAMVGEHDEDKEDAQTHGGHCEEIDSDEVPDVVGQERPPGLG
jgi:hypothetical protein